MPQARKSSIHFAPVTNIKFAVSHSERTELSEPGYLLPKEHQLPNILVDGSLSENELAELFIKQKECMTGQAKARGSSPFWEGVVVLKNTDGEEQSKKLQAWKVAYENATGHKVLHMTIHLDEGYLDKNGKPHYNPHAHVIISRMNEKNRIIQLKRKQLGEVQDLTAEILQMDRGSTLKERGGKRGRVHIGHKEFRIMANEARLDLEKGNNQKDFYVNLLDYKNQQDDINREKIKEANKVIAEKDAEIARLKAEHKAEVQQLKTEYSIDRAALKASGEATQRDYQQLKKDHEAKVAKLQEAHAEKMLELENKIQAAAEEKTKTLDEKDAEIARLENEYKAEIARLKSEYSAEREELKASGTARQSHYQQLKATHEAALADLTASKAQAAKVPRLEQQAAQQAQELAKARQEAAKAEQGRDEAVGKATQQAAEIERLKAAYAAERAQLKASGTATQQDYQQLKATHEAALADLTASKAQAAKVPRLEQQAAQQAQELAKAQQQAEQVQVLERQLKAAQQEAINTKLTADERYKNLRGQALAIQAERDELLKSAATRQPAPQTQPERRPAPAAPAQTLAPRPAPQPVPRPTPAPAQTLAERLRESFEALVNWVKKQGGGLKEIDTERAQCFGAVVQLDDLHAVQRVGRGTYAIHKLDQLDKVPALDDSKTEIKYSSGRGTVSGAVQSREKDRR
jgi:hypothetical protein